MLSLNKVLRYWDCNFFYLTLDDNENVRTVEKRNWRN